MHLYAPALEALIGERNPPPVTRIQSLAGMTAQYKAVEELRGWIEAGDIASWPLLRHSAMSAFVPLSSGIASNIDEAVETLKASGVARVSVAARAILAK